jgi:NTP pyrophosphatase (non-canonical NTP hydrolase)
MDFKRLNDKIVGWADEKGILDNATPLSQLGKTIEEVEELKKAVTAQSKGMDHFYNLEGEALDTDTEIKDAIGDIMVTLMIQAKMQGLDPLECLETVYNIISKRTGKMVDGVFVKNE